MSVGLFFCALSDGFIFKYEHFMETEPCLSATVDQH